MNRVVQAVFLNALAAALVLALVGKAAGAESAEELIRKGDGFSAKLEATEALKFYLPAENLDSNNVSLLVRISRQYRHLMSDAKNPREKLVLGNTAVSYAERAVALEPVNPDAQLAVAISYGKRSPFEGNKQKIASAQRVKIAVDKAIELDPTNDLSWQILGRWYLAHAELGSMKRVFAEMKYGKLPTATYGDAARCFEKAIELNPNRLMHYIELGRTYAEMGRKVDARKYINKGLAMPETEKDDPEFKKLGRQSLKKLD